LEIGNTTNPDEGIWFVLMKMSPLFLKLNIYLEASQQVNRFTPRAIIRDVGTVVQ